MGTKYLIWIMAIIAVIWWTPLLLKTINNSKGNIETTQKIKDINIDFQKEDLTTIIRKWRLKACSQWYLEYQNHIKQVYRLDENAIVRCFVFMTLVYAFESNYWQSRMCLEDKNCFWIKEPTYKWPLDWINYRVWNNRFLIMKSFDDNNLLFARLFYRWHLNKSIDVFVRDWSMTDQEVYIWFMKDEYNYFKNIAYQLIEQEYYAK